MYSKLGHLILSENYSTVVQHLPNQVLAGVKNLPPENVDEWPDLSTREDGIHRCSGVEHLGSAQIIVHRSLTSGVLQMLHDDQGHFRTAKTSATVKERFSSLHISLDIREWCRNCLLCQGRKTQSLQEDLHCKSPLAALGNW